jgi:hypothetical protein
MSDEEAKIDTKLRETERAIAELQRERQELLGAKAAMVKARTPQPPPQQETDVKALERALNMLEWNAFKKKDGEWAFMRNRDGTLVEDLKPIVDFIDQLRKGRRIVVGRYEYVASEDKFLNRYISGNH